ncbi:MAG: hypothetical protein ACYST6_10330 [Planctomycetota bacterium]|jgi:hypothetical protein
MCSDDFDCKYCDEGVCKPCLYKASDYEELEACEEDEEGYPVEEWVFDYFDGDSCSN